MVDTGSIAIVHITGRLIDAPEAGKVFETTDVDVALEEGIYHDQRDFKPLEFRVGEGHVIPGIDRAVQELEQGETTTVVLDAAEAYGQRNDRDAVTVSREALADRSGKDPAVDDFVRSENGDVGWVSEVSADTVTVDFNHELAGETVEFEIRLLEVHATETGHGPVVSRDGSA
jgi:FKBP-type peptidyl-prolyl cis-trans isomerase SlyD